MDILALDDALERLAAFDPRKSRIVELRFFGGLDVNETAAALDVSPQTVQRDWRLAKVWLFRELSGGHRVEPERGVRSSDSTSQRSGARKATAWRF